MSKFNPIPNKPILSYFSSIEQYKDEVPYSQWPDVVRLQAKMALKYDVLAGARAQDCVHIPYIAALHTAYLNLTHHRDNEGDTYRINIIRNLSLYRQAGGILFD